MRGAGGDGGEARGGERRKRSRRALYRVGIQAPGYCAENVLESTRCFIR